MKRPFTLWLLLFFLLFLALGGFVGAYHFLTDPSGGSLGMTKELENLPVQNYALPGLFLLVVMGLTPLFLTYSLLTRPKWTLAQRLLRFTPHHWSWTATLLLSIALVLWLIVEAYFIGFNAVIQWVTAINGLGILVLTVMPGVRNYYQELRLTESEASRGDPS